MGDKGPKFFDLKCYLIQYCPWGVKKIACKTGTGLIESIALKQAGIAWKMRRQHSPRKPKVSSLPARVQ
jgi:hypothetical protein